MPQCQPSDSQTVSRTLCPSNVCTHTHAHTLLCLAHSVPVGCCGGLGCFPTLPLHPSVENNHKNRKQWIQARRPMKGPAERVQRRSPFSVRVEQETARA